MKKVSHAWLFDVDGVITHSAKKKITEPKILDEMIKRLQKGEPIALVTGRSNSWMIRQVIKPLESKAPNTEILKNFIGVGEKGATWTVFENGNLKKFVDKNFVIPKEIEKEVKELIASKFSKWMFLDETKETMISVEMKDGLNISDFTPYQRQMDKILEEILENHDVEKQHKIISSRIATDIQDKRVGKDYAAQKVLKWLKSQEIEIKKFICFGDSAQDLDMAKYIFEQGLPIEFVFVGEKHLIDKKDYPFPVVLTHQPCEKGTLQYLTSNT